MAEVSGVCSRGGRVWPNLANINPAGSAARSSVTNNCGLDGEQNHGQTHPPPGQARNLPQRQH